MPPVAPRGRAGPPSSWPVNTCARAVPGRASRWRPPLPADCRGPGPRSAVPCLHARSAPPAAVRCPLALSGSASPPPLSALSPGRFPARTPRAGAREGSQGQGPAPGPSPPLWLGQPEAGRGRSGWLPPSGRRGAPAVFSTLLLSCPHPPHPGCPLPAPVSPWGFWWPQSSSLGEANDLPLCEAYWRPDPDTDSADGLAAPPLASPEPGAGPLPAAATAHAHAGGPGPTEHA